MKRRLLYPDSASVIRTAEIYGANFRRLARTINPSVLADSGAFL